MLGAAPPSKTSEGGSQSKNYYHDGLRRAIYIQPVVEERMGLPRSSREPRLCAKPLRGAGLPLLCRS